MSQMTRRFKCDGCGLFLRANNTEEARDAETAELYAATELPAEDDVATTCTECYLRVLDHIISQPDHPDRAGAVAIRARYE